MLTGHMLTLEETRAARERYLADPGLWMRDILRARPWPVQVRIAEAVRDHKRVVVPSCHSSGKSWIAARIATWFLTLHIPSRVVLTAPTHRQVRRVLWTEVRQAYAGAAGPLARTPPLPGEPRWTIDDGWELLGFSTDDPDRFQGLHAPHVLVIMDEAPGIPAPIWAAVEGVLASGDARLLAIGNPVEPSGEFWDLCRPGSGAHKIAISAFDTPNLTRAGITQREIEEDVWQERVAHRLPYPSLVGPDWVAERYRRWGPNSPMYLSRVLGQFLQSATDALLYLSWVTAAQQVELKSSEPCVLGVDVARFGDAETVGMLRRGSVAELAFTSAQEDTMQTAGRVVAAIRQHRPSACYIDEIGIGAGVLDRLREVTREQTPRCRLVGLNSGERPNDTEQFANARAEWWWGLRERFEAGDIAIPDDDELAAQLTALKFRYTSRGQVLIESKEDMRKRGLASPDRADALMLAFARGEPSGGIIRPGSRPHPKLSPGQAWLEDIGGDDDGRRRKRGWF